MIDVPAEPARLPPQPGADRIQFGWDAVGLMRMKTDADGRLTIFGYFGHDATPNRSFNRTRTNDWAYANGDSTGTATELSVPAGCMSGNA